MGRVFFVHGDDPLVAALDEGDVRLDQPGFGAVVALAGPGIEGADKVDGALRLLDRFAADFGELARIALLQQQHVGVDDLLRQLENQQPSIFLRMRPLGLCAVTIRSGVGGKVGWVAGAGTVEAV